MSINVSSISGWITHVSKGVNVYSLSVNNILMFTITIYVWKCLNVWDFKKHFSLRAILFSVKGF